MTEVLPYLTDSPTHNGRIFVASRNNLLVTGLTVLLGRAGFHVAGFAGDTSEAVAEFDRTASALCLLDMDLPGDLTFAVREMSRTSWVVLLGSGNRPFDEPIHQSLRAGAVGYIAADIDSARLPHVLTAVMNGEVGIPRHMVAGLLAQLQNQPTRAVGVQGRRPVRFTTREWEVLQHLKDGRSTRQIALQLGVSAVTVRTHVAAMCRKVRVPNREGLLRLVCLFDLRTRVVPVPAADPNRRRRSPDGVALADRTHAEGHRRSSVCEGGLQ